MFMRNMVMNSIRENIPKERLAYLKQKLQIGQTEGSPFAIILNNSTLLKYFDVTCKVCHCGNEKSSPKSKSKFKIVLIKDIHGQYATILLSGKFLSWIMETKKVYLLKK